MSEPRPAPVHEPLSVSIVIPTWNGAQFIEACLDSLVECTEPPYEIIVVDNGSRDDSAALVRTFGNRHPNRSIRLIENDVNMGFASAINTGVAAAQGGLLVLMNQDVVAQPAWLAPLRMGFDAAPTIGIIGSKLLYPDGRVQHAGGHLLLPSWEGIHYTDDAPTNPIDFVTGAVMAIRRTCWDVVGPLDTEYYPAYYEDVDFCLRARKRGWEIKYEPKSVLIHHESTTRASGLRQVADFHAQRLRCALKHQPVDWLSTAFLPAELERIERSAVAEWRYGLADAFLRAALGFPNVRPDLTPDQQQALVTQLLRLRDMAYTIVPQAQS